MYLQEKEAENLNQSSHFPTFPTSFANISLCAQTFSLWCSLKITDMRKRTGWQRNHRKHPCGKYKYNHMIT